MKQPTILDDGDSIQVFFQQQQSNRTTTSTSTSNQKHCNENDDTHDQYESKKFQTPWLWMNDPSNNYYMPSGQKKNSPGSFDIRTKIHSAVIELRKPCTGGGSGGVTSTSSVGSIHPFSVQNDSSVTKHYEGSRDDWILVITWCCCAKEEEEDSQSSFYNLDWLYQWSYENDKILDAIQQREVNKTHTFMHKFYEQNGPTFTTPPPDSNNNNNNDEHHVDNGRITRLVKYNGLRHISYTNVIIEETNAVTATDHEEKQKEDGIRSDSSSSNAEFLELFDALFLDGAAIVTNVPEMKLDPDKAVSQIGKMIGGGYLSHSSLYGATFHVKSSLNAMNVAYTSTRLCPHQDLAYYESKPGFQFLHCIESDKKCIQGGESLLIDVMAAAHEFRSLAPCYFNILTKCHATFVKERNGALMTYTRPHIQISSHCIGGVKENHVVEEIVAVHWAPPFEGQLSIPHELLKSYFEAYAAFELMVDKLIEPRNRSLTSGIDLELALKLSKYANKYTWEYRLNKGEMIIFNNTRMLHARNEFNTIDEKKILNSSTIDDYDVNTKKIRHLVGAYTNIDDTLNTYRVMMKQKLLSRILPNVGNGSPMLQTKI